MKPFSYGLLLLMTSILLIWHSDLEAYQPMGAWIDQSVASFDHWESLRQMTSAPTVDGNRPALFGASGRNLELLQDAVARKYPRVTQGQQLTVARRVLASTPDSSFPKLRGYMAEAIFLDNHPDYGYIGKVNASQHDVYMKNPSGGPGIITGQVKFVMDGNPGTYARHMVNDHRSKHFFVPDDHIDSLRTFLRREGDRLYKEGKLEESQRYYRNMNRVKGIGATSAQVDSATRQAITEARFIRVAPYVFLGVAAVMTVGPTAAEWYRGDISVSEAAHRFGKGGSALLTGFAVDKALVLYRGGILRGTLRGNVLTAAAVLFVDTGWQIYERGGIYEAIQDPELLMRFGGDIGATTCALVGGSIGAQGGAAVGSSAGGPLGSMIGGIAGGIIGGAASGLAGYYGGSTATRYFLKKFAPDVLYEEENRYVKMVLENISRDIEKANAF